MSESLIDRISREHEITVEPTMATESGRELYHCAWADPDVVRGLELTPAQPEHWWISYSPLWGILDQPEVRP